MFLKTVTLSALICTVWSNKVSDDLIDDWNNIASQYAAECIERTGANPVLVDSMFKEHKLVDEEHVRCYIMCLNEKYEYILPDGNFDGDKIVNDVEHVTYDIMDRCGKKVENEKDLCKKSYLLALCFAEENYSV
ncbi:hypothetical protein FQR65_LT12145 [Abscondita terminalis]|nr:hypothetical protein FQR65_LT12145 [Abscondita terminalis]